MKPIFIMACEDMIEKLDKLDSIFEPKFTKVVRKLRIESILSYEDMKDIICGFVVGVLYLVYLENFRIAFQL